jgi:hypothetical protein
MDVYKLGRYIKGVSFGLSDNGYAIILSVIFLAFSAILAWHHEMWQDEMQAWLIARDSSSLIQLLKNLKYEGHPGLWHLCLYVLKFITRSPIIMQVFHLMIAGATVYTFSRFSPFTKLQKALFAFGYLSFYEYAIICRNYAIGVFLLFLFCALFPKWRERPLLAGFILLLLAHTSVHALIVTISIGLALVLNCLLIRRENLTTEKRREVKRVTYYLNRAKIGIGFSLILLGSITSAILMKPPPDSGFAVGWKTDFALDHLLNVIRVIPNAFFPIPQFTFHFWGSNLLDRLPASSVVKLVLSGLILILAILLLRRSPTALLTYLSGTIGLLAFFYTKYFGSIRHHGFLFMLFIASVWISCSSDAKPLSGSLSRFSLLIERHMGKVLTAILVTHLVGGVAAASMDYIYPFSQARTAARFIRERKMDDMVMVGDASSEASTVVGYSGKKECYYPEGHRFGSFVKWDKEWAKRSSSEDTLQEARRLADLNKQDILILLNYPLEADAISRYSLREIARFEKAIYGGEEYYLYCQPKGN